MLPTSHCIYFNFHCPPLHLISQLHIIPEFTFSHRFLYFSVANTFHSFARWSSPLVNILLGALSSYWIKHSLEREAHRPPSPGQTGAPLKWPARPQEKHPCASSPRHVSPLRWPPRGHVGHVWLALASCKGGWMYLVWLSCSTFKETCSCRSLALTTFTSFNTAGTFSTPAATPKNKRCFELSWKRIFLTKALLIGKSNWPWQFVVITSPPSHVTYLLSVWQCAPAPYATFPSSPLSAALE